MRFSNNFFRTSASEKQESNASVILLILPQKNPRTSQNTAIFTDFYLSREPCWPSGRNSVQHEYSIRSTNHRASLNRMHCLVQQVGKFFDFCEIPIGQNVSNFSPCSHYIYLDLCVCFPCAYTFFVNICQRLTTSSSPITRFSSFNNFHGYKK